MTRINRIAARILKWLVAIELAYLLLVNAALQLGLTQDLVNSIRPDKFQVTWEHAWSWYPFRVNAGGVIASGQSRSQQWQLQADEAVGSIRLLPLLLKRVHLSAVHAQNVDYRQRPRLKPDRDYSNLLEHFPDIAGREITPADTSPRKNKRPWTISLSSASASGQHSFWIFNLQGTGSGSLSAAMELQTRGGPFRLDATNIDLQLGPAYVNGSTELFHRGELAGAMGFSPFVPRENRGLRMLPFVWLNADLDLQVGSLGFLNLFTSSLGNMVISGAGRLQGHIALSEGYLKAGTQLTATTDELSVVIRDMDVSGKGHIRVHTPTDQDFPMGMDISYDSVSVNRLGDVDAFLAGDSLALAFRGSNYIVPDPGVDFRQLRDNERAMERHKDNTVKLLVDDATLLDVSIINDYMPSDTPLAFTGGVAKLQADLFMGLETASGSIELDSTDVRMEVDGQQLRADLLAEVVVVDGVPSETRFDLSGSRILLDRVRVVGATDEFSDADWSAELALQEAEVVVQPSLKLETTAGLRVSDTRPLVTMFDNRGDPPGWVSNLMTLRDLQGKARLEMEEGRVQIPLARVTSDKAEVAAKALFADGVKNGVVYARYKKLDLLLRTENNKRDIDVINVRKKFDQYSPPGD